MRVLTLDNGAFANACHRLSEQVKASGFTPDILVGIRRGGAFVADIMHEDITDAGLVYVCAQRPSSRLKRIITPLLRCLPFFITDFLRKTESMLARRRKSVALYYDIAVPDELMSAGVKKILVVDDAVDRGKTLLSVVGKLHELSPGAEIKSAVITVTQPSPMIMPDYCLYNDLTLIRFPWAPDAKINV